jgi:hypothetical protein
MITLKPKSSVQTILFALLAVAYGITFLLAGYVASGKQSLWLYVGVVLMMVTTILFTIKVLMGYKTLQIDKEKIIVKYLFRTYTFDLKALTFWEEIVIKTFNKQEFKQIDLVFGQVKVSFSEQEHTNYAQLIQFLKKKGKK